MFIQASLPLPFEPRNFGAHLGTLTFQRSADDTTPIYDPSLIAIATNNTWNITGPYSWGSNAYGPVYANNYTINLYPHAVYRLDGSLVLNRLSPNAGKVPLTTTGSNGIDESTFIVDLYVANVDKHFSGSQLNPMESTSSMKEILELSPLQLQLQIKPSGNLEGLIFQLLGFLLLRPAPISESIPVVLSFILSDTYSLFKTTSHSPLTKYLPQARPK